MNSREKFEAGIVTAAKPDPGIVYLEKAGWRYNSGYWTSYVFTNYKLKVDPIRKTFILYKAEKQLYSMPLSRLTDKLIEQNIYVEVSQA